MPDLIISPVGTSILTNGASEEEREILRRTANMREDELSENARQRIDKIVEDRRSETSHTKRYEDYKRFSAELNGIFSYKFPDNLNHYILIVTDTYQGRKSAELIKEILQRYTFNVLVPELNNLSTKSSEEFESGLHDLMGYLSNTIRDYKAQKFDIIFNLTGGFKSLIGYLNVTAMVLQADKVVYIFETSNELITIPRIPLKLDKEIVWENIKLMALLSLEDGRKSFSVSELNNAGILTDNIYEALFQTIGSEEDRIISLSPYGYLIWNEMADEVYEGLLDLPYIEYTKRFKESFEKCASNENFKKAVNEGLYRIAAIFIEKGFDTSHLKTDSALQYEKFKGGIGHIRMSGRPNSYRAVCIPLEDRLLMIDCGLHDLNKKYQEMTEREALEKFNR